MTPTKVLFGQILVVFGIVALSLSLATQWTAASLGYQAQLGQPWTVFHGVPLYQPWLFFVWWFQFDAYAPEVFQRGAYVAASGGYSAHSPPWRAPSGVPAKPSSSPLTVRRDGRMRVT